MSIIIGGAKKPTEEPTAEIIQSSAEVAKEKTRGFNVEGVDTFIQENLKKLAQHLAQGSRNAGALSEQDLEKTLEEFLLRETDQTAYLDWDFTHILLKKATLEGEEGNIRKNKILRTISETNRNSEFSNYAAMEVVIPGTYSDLREESVVWKSLLMTGSVVLSYTNPGIFCIGSLTAWHLQLSTYILSKLWEGTRKEDKHKPFVSGFNLPYSSWQKLYDEQKVVLLH